MYKFNLENKILEKIKDENLQPKPAAYFLVKDFSLWGLVILSIIFTSLTLSPIIFIFSNLELEFIKLVAPNIFVFILFIFPYFWFLLSVIAIYFAKIAWYNTKTGYKFDGKYVLIISGLLSIILSLIFNIFHMGKILDDEAGKRGPKFVKSFENRRKENWNQRNEGRIFGKISDVSTNTFAIERKIITDNSEGTTSVNIFYNENTIGKEFIESENFVRIILENSTDTDKMFACAILEDKFFPAKFKKTSQSTNEDKVSENYKKSIFEKCFHQ